MIETNFISKFKYAIKGLVYLWRREKSFRWQVVAAVLVQVVALGLRLEATIWALLTLTSAIVLCAEAFNTVLERLLDIVEPRLSTQVSLLKDLLAAAVLIVVLAALAVVLIILI
ncbi:MAG TPA: diacylglycerol kinase [Candidatus Veblenbacteria bacterium]|uniref:Diacylglycerol kinase n=4 Tax=Candidatus Vebleniibacteriota TaxID=1817921 RepID=A0A1G2Q4L7_9BACT|nr:MAG: Diacylglycerolkinase [Parcubacteria group bacterium GW2011_GWE2_43_12]KKT13097.1 MAG: Diacylglycerolkinase [Parcubacteria group bacterium GW2011_GWA1_43_27]KKT14536.1 MAG: Diacylglycerolkinase [Parcubacteria group bacterium GW2011_GWF2_43_38]KKT16671.1 MAG: Diacylglycerolkinase [Parcubacteria group bacterium GW2011_GWB1_43_66]KKT20973.1 MAG: Diacylglycerolkinase [Parcubacteria group bacterium GW2011_GWE1_43_8]KKT27409.1 MAG: Diacylglycerolkinase [Parcubacteria group bacterium GW2011_GW